MDDLEAVHGRLEAHFESLRQERDTHGGGKPLFALEHGLDDAAVVELQRCVRGAIRVGRPSPKWWLPYVVYAAEVGYRYTGEEYWHTFAITTPGWVEHGDRHYVRQRFRAFAERFGGAVPTGPWAGHFSIICWPITHAVLPTDLQIQLARLLYEYRYLLSAELLASPKALGETLGSRTWHSSARFQNFAQNTELLGQVATALLLDEEGSSALLLGSTLARIVGDLSKQRQARRWLTDAKRTALRVNLRGLTRPSTGVRGVASSASATTKPPLRVSDARLVAGDVGDAGWAIHVALPDMRPLAARFPELQEVLRTSRCKLAGVKRPLARGQVMYSDQRFRLDTWPGADAPLLSLEQSDARYDAHLADECRVPPGPTWVFRLVDGLGQESRGKTIRPERRYLMVSEAPAGLPVWAKRVSIACEGLYGYEFELPMPLDPSHVEVLQGLGVTLMTDVEVRPAGLVPAAWDSEGAAEWVIGDVPLLALSSTREVQRAVIAVDGADPTPVGWNRSPDSSPAYVALEDLGVGLHEVRVTVIPTGAEIFPITGSLFVTIREPVARGSTGTYREPLLLRSSPPLPTLEEVWEGQVALEIIGPEQVMVDTRVCLEGARGGILASKKLQGLRLPVGGQAWNAAFGSQFRAASDVHRHYDDATGLMIEVSHPELGSTSLRCERPFAPLRWGVGRDRHGPFVRLHDNSGAGTLSVVRFEFAVPDVGVPVSLEAESKVRWTAGGLFVARLPDFEATVVLAPLVRDLTDLQRLMTPRVSSADRSVDGVLKLMTLSRLWANASLPGDPFAQKQRDAVLRAFTTAICGLIGGQRWARAERCVATDTATALRDLGDALGEQSYQRALRAALERQERRSESSVAERVLQFAGVLSGIGSRSGVWRKEQWASQWLLRLVSSPPAALDWCEDDVRDAVRLAIESPTIVRAARYVVLAWHLDFDDGEGPASQWGWAWQ